MEETNQKRSEMKVCSTHIPTYTQRYAHEYAHQQRHGNYSWIPEQKLYKRIKVSKKKNCGLCCIRQARERISGLQTNACKEEWTKIKLAGRLLNSKSIEIISFWITEFGHGPDTNSFRISTRPNFEHFRARTILFIKSTSCILSAMVTCCSSI